MGIALFIATMYFWVVALQVKSTKNAIFAGAAAGIATGLLGLVWGGVTYIFISFALFMAVWFWLGYSKKDFAAYAAWVIVFTVMLSFFTAKYGRLQGLFTSTTSGAAYFVLFLLFVDFVFSKKILIKSQGKKWQKLITALFTFMFVLFVVGIMNRAMLVHVFSDVKQKLLFPLGRERFTLTVAENNQPYFSAWRSNFGLGFFWLFFASSAFLLGNATKKLRKKQNIVLVVSYVIAFTCLIFSRYSPQSKLDGVSGVAVFVYFAGLLLLLFAILAVYINVQRKGEQGKLETINPEAILLLVLFLWAIISARGAIRLFFFLPPVLALLTAYICIELPSRAIKKDIKDELSRLFLWLCVAFIIVIVLFSFFNFAQATIMEAKATVPSSYEQQWQLAMAWVRNNTPQNSVFAHWWDYGYWVQTLGERATVLDGGNAIVYWDYLMGRYALTGNETEALQFLFSHNATHLLIDSTDISKYAAFSSIGSDVNYDRYSQIATFTITNEEERKNETIYVYQGGTVFDNDFVWYDKESQAQVFFPSWNIDSVIGGFLLHVNKEKKPTKAEAIAINAGKQYRIPIKHVYLAQEGKLYSFDEGIESCLYIIPALITNKGTFSFNPAGAVLYLSEKVYRGNLAQLYLLNASKNFELVHTESSLLVKQLRQQGMEVPEFVYYGGVHGPIKIWQINYPADMQVNQSYLETDFPDIKLTIAKIGF